MLVTGVRLCLLQSGCSRASHLSTTRPLTNSIYTFAISLPKTSREDVTLTRSLKLACFKPCHTQLSICQASSDAANSGQAAATDRTPTSKEESATTKSTSVKYTSAFQARQFIDTLNAEERTVLRQELENVDKLERELQADKKTPTRPTYTQIMLLALQSGLPFVGFGFVDNFIMIVAGDLIESYIGVYLPITTMAAAGLGNAVSDVGGIGLAHHIEYICSKFVKQPRLTNDQWTLPIVNWTAILATLQFMVETLQTGMKEYEE